MIPQTIVGPRTSEDVNVNFNRLTEADAVRRQFSFTLLARVRQCVKKMGGYLLYR